MKVFSKRLFLVLAAFACCVTAKAELFGTGANQFTLDFVSISGETNPTNTSISGGYGIVKYDYRMSTCAISNDQWNKFKASLGMPVTGAGGGYNWNFYDYGTGTTNVPANNISWYEAAQFVNWLNTSAGHQPAYKFTGTQGTSDYTFATWSAAEAAEGTNLYRNKDAYYFLPTEDEWVKAAYFNGSSLQLFATKPGDSLFQGNGTNGGWNYFISGSATNPIGPWDVTNGNQELNGTYNMMGNVWEWMESPSSDTTYGPSSSRGMRGGAFANSSGSLASSVRSLTLPTNESRLQGFRVACVPEPSSLMLTAILAATSLLYFRRKNR